MNAETERQSDGTAAPEHEIKQEAERRLPCMACCASSFFFTNEELRHREKMALWNDTIARLKKAVWYGNLAIILSGVALLLATSTLLWRLSTQQ